MVFGLLLVIVVIVIFGTLMASLGFGMSLSLVGPFCAVAVIGIVLLVVALSGGMQRRVLPPPPPIQQPMVPAGTRPPVELACPNCGAPPKSVDRFGVATCDYCDTRFLAR